MIAQVDIHLADIREVGIFETELQTIDGLVKRGQISHARDLACHFNEFGDGYIVARINEAENDRLDILYESLKGWT